MISWEPIDDFRQGPKVLTMRCVGYYHLHLRLRPFWLYVKLYGTRASLLRQFRDMLLDPEKQRVWTPATFELGER